MSVCGYYCNIRDEINGRYQMIHQTAVIDKGAVIEENLEIGPYTIVGPSTIIKSGTKIHGQSVIEYAEIGNNCEIFNFSSVGKCPQDLKYHGEKTKVVVGDDAFISGYVGIQQFTKIGKGTMDAPLLWI